MALQINITPSFGDNGNGVPTTELEIIIDLTSILSMLIKYDLLLKTTLSVRTVNVISKEEEVNVYEYAKVYKEIKDNFISFKTIAIGYITDSESISGIAEGIFVNKKGNEVDG